MPRLFEKFASKSFQGTGLGLYICKGIIEAHGGRIWAENNTGGKGATFSFSLPIANSLAILYLIRFCRKHHQYYKISKFMHVCMYL